MRDGLSRYLIIGRQCAAFLINFNFHLKEQKMYFGMRLAICFPSLPCLWIWLLLLYWLFSRAISGLQNLSSCVVFSVDACGTSSQSLARWRRHAALLVSSKIYRSGSALHVLTPCNLPWSPSTSIHPVCRLSASRCCSSAWWESKHEHSSRSREPLISARFIFKICAPCHFYSADPQEAVLNFGRASAHCY